MATMRAAHMKAATAKSTAKNVKVHIKSFEKKIRTLKPFLESTVILIEKTQKIVGGVIAKRLEAEKKFGAKQFESIMAELMGIFDDLVREAAIMAEDEALKMDHFITPKFEADNILKTVNESVVMTF